MSDFLIDLDDGMPAARVETREKPRATGPNALLHRAPEKIEITVTPVAIAISYAPVRCLGCGAVHKDHRGVFVENRLSNGVKQFRRLSIREVGAYAALPRRVDISPEEVVPICSECWVIDAIFQQFAALSVAQGDLFGAPGESKPVTEVITQLHALPPAEPEEEEAEPAPLEIELEEGEL